MSNERRNPYHKKKHPKNSASATTATIVTRAGAARRNETEETMAVARATVYHPENEMNVSIEYDANAGLNDLNESMISTVSSVNPQDLDQAAMTVTQTTTQTTNTNPTYITNLEATMENNVGQATNTTIPRASPNVTPGRIMIVNNESPANPNDVETFAVRLRQQATGTRFRTTPTTPQVSQEYTYIGYYDVKVRVERSDNPWEELIEATKEIFIQLWKMDPSIKVFVYERAERFSDSSFISNVADFRKVSFFNFDKYFYRGAPLPFGGSRTLNILMTHTMSFDNIMKQMGPVLTGMQCGVYRRTLQAEKTTTIGWAYMSTKHTNKQTLAEAITEKIRIPVGLQWRMITTGQAISELTEEQKVRAIHFEVEDCDITYAKKILNEVYHHSKTDGFPLGMKFRFMPMYANIPNTDGQNSLMTMVGFQQRYCRFIGDYISGDITNLDGTLPNGVSIRQYLMDMRVDGDMRKRLFLGINKTWNNRGYVYSVLPKHRDLASITIQHLLTKLHFEFPNASDDGKVFPDIDKFFDVVAWERAQETTWDANRNCAIAINMDNLQGTLDAMKGDDFFETFYEQEGDNKVEKKPDDGTDKEKLMIDTDGRSIATRTRASRRSEVATQRGTPPSGTRVSFGDSVASPITVGTTAAGSILTMADVQSMVTTTVLPMIAKEVAKEVSQAQERIQERTHGSLASFFTQMQNNMTTFQQTQQQQQQQFQQQQQQIQYQQQQQFLQQLAQQATINNQDVQTMEVITQEQQRLLYDQQQRQQQQQQHQQVGQQAHQHPHHQHQAQNQQFAAHPMEDEQHEL
jgi:hypothetical protein